MLERLFRSNAEVSILGVVLFSDNLHLREIARQAKVSSFEAKRELDSLVQIGVLSKSKKGIMSFYTQNPNCSFLSELKGLYIKTEGSIPMLKKELKKFKQINYAFIYGSFANKTFNQQSDIDLFIIADIDAQFIAQSCFNVQKKTLQEINYILWNPNDFKKKIREGGAFISSILKKEKIFLIGDVHDFERDVAKARNRKNRT
jgi:predicted nucleotidyltransferase